MKGKNTKHTSVDYYNTLFVLLNIICTRKKIKDHKNLVCDKEKFVLTKTYIIGNLGIWSCFFTGLHVHGINFYVSPIFFLKTVLSLFITLSFFVKHDIFFSQFNI